MTTFLFISLAYLLPLFQSQVYNCLWTSPQGVKYDLNKLYKKNGWHAKSDDADQQLFSLSYSFNFCAPFPKQCHGVPAVALEKFNILNKDDDNNCKILGTAESQKIENIDQNNVNAGIRVTYSDGDICDDKKVTPVQRSISFVLKCNPYWDDEFQVTKSNDQCSVELTFQSPLGCGEGKMVQAENILYTVFKIILGIYLCYVLVGFLYNLTVNQYRGVEAIPQYEMWSGLGENIKQIGQHIAGNTNKGYTTV